MFQVPRPPQAAKHVKEFNAETDENWKAYWWVGHWGWGCLVDSNYFTTGMHPRYVSALVSSPPVPSPLLPSLPFPFPPFPPSLPWMQ